MSVCLPVCEDISGTTCAIFTNFVHVAYGHGSVLLRHCDMLFISSFMDDIMFLFYIRPYNGMKFTMKD